MITKLGTAALAVGALMASTLIDAQPAQAQWSWTSPYTWCAQWSGWAGGTKDCSYVTFEQCHAAIFGAGGGCSPNPAYAGPREDYRPARKHRRRAH